MFFIFSWSLLLKVNTVRTDDLLKWILKTRAFNQLSAASTQRARVHSAAHLISLTSNATRMTSRACCAVLRCAFSATSLHLMHLRSILVPSFSFGLPCSNFTQKRERWLHLRSLQLQRSTQRPLRVNVQHNEEKTRENIAPSLSRPSTPFVINRATTFTTAFNIAKKYRIQKPKWHDIIAQKYTIGANPAYSVLNVRKSNLAVVWS